MTTRTQRPCIVLLVSLALSACASDKDEAPESSPPPVEDTVFGAAVGTLDAARSVESTSLEHKEALDEALEREAGASE
jgi:hypothetical protein